MEEAIECGGYVANLAEKIKQDGFQLFVTPKQEDGFRSWEIRGEDYTTKQPVVIASGSSKIGTMFLGTIEGAIMGLDNDYEARIKEWTIKNFNSGIETENK